MTLHHSAASVGAPSLRFTPALFAGTLFASALLLFAVQPMFTKMVLPSLGGSPAVWSVAMVFFQAALLLGYAYAHLLARTLTVGHGALVHLGVIGAAALTLPIGIAHGFEAPPSSGVGFWLVGLFAASIGLPFAALSASAPLLQSWFARSGHVQAGNPYVLYAASNLGSFAALLAYPFLIESTLSLRSQAWIWSIGFAVLAVLVAAAGIVAARGTGERAAGAHNADDVAAAKPTVRDRLSWIALAAIPAGLVIAVTAYISTDVAAAPLLWVLPLALYLLTFVAVFRDKPWFSRDIVIRVVPFIAAPLAITLLNGSREYWITTIAINLLGLFVLALACHSEIYRRRPAPALLTAFYLWTSFGGVVGGIFAGLLAPYLFNATYEYPILVVAAVLALPGAFSGTVRQFLRRMWPAFAALAFVLVHALGFALPQTTQVSVVLQIGLLLLAAWMIVQRRDPMRLAALMIAALIVTGVVQSGSNVVETARSFFGVHRVVDVSGPGGTIRALYHGTTIHGAERLREADGAPATGRPAPLTYYYPGGPISEAIEAARARLGALKNVAVVGLGAGALACHRRDGENWTFFEIDPEVVRLARDPNMFRFLASCAPSAPIVLGDARLTLNASREQFDVIMLDAFTSDAIPTHLLTREALRGYLAHLKPHGVIVANITNRHIELASVFAAVGASEGLVMMRRADQGARQFMIDFHAPATAAALARSEEDLGSLVQASGWQRIDRGNVVPWTDDYADIMGAILRKKLGS